MRGVLAELTVDPGERPGLIGRRELVVDEQVRLLVAVELAMADEMEDMGLGTGGTRPRSPFATSGGVVIRWTLPGLATEGLLRAASSSCSGSTVLAFRPFRADNDEDPDKPIAKPRARFEIKVLAADHGGGQESAAGKMLACPSVPTGAPATYRARNPG